ncbi:hypothetical protein [Undibacterium sp.]|uniref:hypothetical protein n=1 Tax=Undibacterium sp. TaxID=1914977 RepID=UPI00273140E7|nr:hypothetical protein [Undibacterium sp.]MDP1976628.1 hypothetical protein [Undibacterium sp.]
MNYVKIKLHRTANCAVLICQSMPALLSVLALCTAGAIFFLRSHINSAGQIYTLDLDSSKKYARQDQGLQRLFLQQLYFSSKD